MNLNGRVHSNSNLYLGSNTGPLCIAGQISSRLNIYNRRKHIETNLSNGIVYLYPNPGDCVGAVADATKRLDNVVPSNTADRDTTNSANFDSTNRPNMTTRFGTNVQDRVPNIRTPSPDFLAKTDSSGRLSAYYTKADLRIEMKSNPTGTALPFNVTSLATDLVGGSGCGASFNVITDRAGAGSLTCTKFQAGQLHSLRQPVLVMTGQVIDDDRLCTAELASVGSAATSPEIVKLTPAEQTKITRALQTAIVSQAGVISYGNITGGQRPSDFPEIGTLFGNYLSTSGMFPSLTAAEVTTLKNTLNGSRFDKIAAIAGDCFKPAPIQKYADFVNGREAMNITMLQTNIESLTIWNRDGLYVDLTVDAAGDPVLASSKYQVTSHNGGQGNSANQLIFKRATIPPSVTTCNATDILCKGSFRHLGLAASDTSEGGLVFHMTVDTNNSPGTNTNYLSRQSPYGFAVVDGSQLPGPLTISSDQAAYIQGDYNFFATTGNTLSGTNSVTTAIQSGTILSNTTIRGGGYKFPASILADSVNITSNSCLDNTNRKLNCGSNPNVKPAATPTTVNAAILGGHAINPINNGAAPSQYSGGLHNYPRFHENWGGQAFNYRGSFVSLGVPLQVSGIFTLNNYNPPLRNWDYDTDFNRVENLPPLTPNMVYLHQRVFSRSYGY